jgi:hypothetical protein
MKGPNLGTHVLSALILGGDAVSAVTLASRPSYKSTNVVTSGSKLSANFILAGTAYDVWS